MAKRKILITVKTYPALSSKYDETVCTAGLTENGEWIRIYPIPFRQLDYGKQYKKYQWIELDLIRRQATKDFRPESYSPQNISSIKFLDTIDTDKGTWSRRKEIVFKSSIFENMDQLKKEALDPKIYRSLATFKPKKIVDFHVEEDESEDKYQKKAPEVIDSLKQLNFFEKSEKAPFQLVERLPYKFFYVFEDETGKTSRLKIEDWEIGALYWNCLKDSEGNETDALRKVKDKYFHQFSEKKDLLFFLGTTLQWHKRKARNPFIIIGVFYPPIVPTPDQYSFSLD